MATARASLYGRTIGGVCPDVVVKHVSENVTASALWVGLGFLIGFLVGLLVAIIIVIVCFPKLKTTKLLKQPRNQKGEDNVHIRDYRGFDEFERSGPSISEKPHVVPAVLLSAGSEKGKKKPKLKVNNACPPIDTLESFEKKYYGNGLIQALVKNNGMSVEVELARQDYAALRTLENSFIDQKYQVFIALLTLELKNFQSINKKQDDDFIHRIISNVEKDFENMVAVTQKGKENQLKDLMKDASLTKDEDTLRIKAEELNVKCHQNYDDRFYNLIEHAKIELMSASGLSSSEAMDVTNNIVKYIGEYDWWMNEDYQNHLKVLDERLLQRRMLCIKLGLVVSDVEGDHRNRQVSFEQCLSNLKKDNQLTAKKFKELLAAFNKSLTTKRDQWEADREFHQRHLAEKLLKRREKQALQIADRHKQEFSVRSQRFLDKERDPTKYLQMVHETSQQQLKELKQFENDFDLQDVTEFTQIKQKLYDSWKTSAADHDKQCQVMISQQSRVTPSDASRLISEYIRQVAVLQDKTRDERQLYQQRLLDKLQEKRRTKEKEAQLNSVHHQNLLSHQTNVLNLTLRYTKDMDESAKDEIFAEHDRSMQRITTHLQAERNKLHKLLELRLLEKRRSKIRTDKKAENFTPGISEQVEKSLVEEERETELKALREQMVAKTDFLLNEHEQKMAALIGKLQVSHARRQAVLFRQNEKIQQFQDKIESRISESGGLPSSQANQITELYCNQVEHLNRRLESQRTSQAREIEEKILARKAEQRNKLEKLANTERLQHQFAQQSKKSTNFASTIFVNLLLEKQHRRRLADLEDELMVEVEREKAALNDELEANLRRELDKQKQDFLLQLSSLRNLSQTDINDIIQSVNKGGEDDESNKFAKKLKRSLKQTRNSSQIGGFDNAAYEDLID